MRAKLALSLALLLTLTACEAPFSLPRAKEPGGLAIAAVLGFSVEAGEIAMQSAAPARASAAASLGTGRGDSVSAALLESRAAGLKSVSYAHVAHLVIEEEFATARLDELLEFAFQNGEQSVQSKLWLLREGELSAIFAPEIDLAGRLDTLRESAAAGSALPTRSLRELAMQWAAGEGVLIPALRLENGSLVYDSYALFQKGKLLAYLNEDSARACALLSGESIRWSERLLQADGSRLSLELLGSGCAVRPVLQDGRLKSLTLRCKIRATVSEGRLQNEEELNARLTRSLETWLALAVTELRDHAVDPLGLRRAAGLRAPLSWEEIDESFATCFPSLPIDIKVVLQIKAS